jgi:WXG100 family type VII secretion target
MAGRQQRQEQRMQNEMGNEMSFDPLTPGADPSALRACAEAWRRMAHDLKTTIEARDREVTSLGDNWTGTAFDAFQDRWNHTKGKAETALPHFAVVAERLDHAADAAQKADGEHTAAVHGGESR